MTIPSLEVFHDNGSFALGAPTFIYDYVLVANTAQTVTIPTFNDSSGNPHPANYAIFSANGDFYARYDTGTAAVPGSNITDGTGSELNPSVREVQRLTTFSIVSPLAAIVSISWYK